MDILRSEINDLRWQIFSDDDIKVLKKLLDDFSLLTGITLVIKDINGDNITPQTEPYNEHCMRLIKKNRLGKKRCDSCDIRWGKIAAKEKKYRVYTCINGLIDFVSPIMFEDEAIGYLFGGQIIIDPDPLNKKHSIKTAKQLKINKKDMILIDKSVKKGKIIFIPKEWYIQNARRLGINETDYLISLEKIPLLSWEKLDASAHMLHTLANYISRILTDNIRLRQQAEAYSEVQTSIGSKEIIKQMLNELKNKLEFKKASIQLIQGETRIQFVCWGFNDDLKNPKLLRPVTKDPLIERIVKKKEPIILSDTQNDLDWKSQPETYDVHSWIGLPIIFEQRVVGVLTLDHDQHGFYKGTEKEELSLFARRVAPIIKHAGELYSANRLIRNMEIVNEVAQIINTKLDVDDLLNSIVTQIASRLGCSHCTIFIPQIENNNLILVPQKTHGGRPQTMKRRFKPGEGIAGWVYQKGESVILEDAKNIEKMNSNLKFSPAKDDRNQPRSMLVVPIKVGGLPIGVISADQDAFGWFSESDRILVEALAKQAGIAIQRSKGLELIQNIGNRIIKLQYIRDTQRVDDILGAVVSGAIKLINVTTGVIYLLDENACTVKKKYHPPDFSMPDPRMDKKDGLTRTVIETGKELCITDITENESVNPYLLNFFKSIIAVPLKIQEKTIGVFFLDDKTQHNFNETEVKLLLTLASQAAIAIQNAQLLDNLHDQIENHQRLESQLESLHQVVREQNLDKILDQIGEGIRKIFGEEISPTINLFDQESGQFIGKCHTYGPLKDKLGVTPRPNGTGRSVLDNHMPLYIKDINDIPTGKVAPRKESFKLGIKSFAAIPLQRQDRAVGVLFINSQKIIEFNEETERLLEIFASQAAVAIENAMLYKELKGKMDQLESVQKVVAETEAIVTRTSISTDYVHRLNNLAGTIPVRVNLIKKNLKENKSKDTIILKHLENIYEDSIGLLKGAEELKKPVKEQNIDICSMITLMLDQIKIQESPLIKVKFNYSNKIPYVYAVESHLKGAIWNIIQNGIESMPKGGKLIVKIKKDRNWINIKIADQGEGIPENAKEKIFVPFFSTKKRKEHMGYGLWRTRNIIERFGGNISFNSKEGKGTTFIVNLPIKTKEERV